jgi:hypothetical protein
LNSSIRSSEAAGIRLWEDRRLAPCSPCCVLLRIINVAPLPLRCQAPHARRNSRHPPLGHVQGCRIVPAPVWLDDDCSLRPSGPVDRQGRNPKAKCGWPPAITVRLVPRRRAYRGPTRTLQHMPNAGGILRPRGLPRAKRPSADARRGGERCAACVAAPDSRRARCARTPQRARSGRQGRENRRQARTPPGRECSTGCWAGKEKRRHSPVSEFGLCEEVSAGPSYRAPMRA